MTRLPQISEAEFEVMKIVWQRAPVNTNEITECLEKTTSWSPKTIQTLIKRLVNKGALTYEKQGRIFVYTPLIGEKEYIGQESSSFLKRFYHGDLTEMVSSFLEEDADHGTFYDTFSVLQPSSLWNHRYLFLSPDSIQNTACRTDAVPSLACAAYTVCHSVSSGSPF